LLSSAVGTVQEVVDQRPERKIAEVAAAGGVQQSVTAKEHDDLVHPQEPGSQ
jgi:hypothetical protein